MSAVTSHRTSLSPRLAVSVILLALAAWGVVLFRQLHKSPAQSHIDAGNAYARRGDGLSAVREWRAATQLEPDNAFAWQLLGQSYFEARMWRQAKEALLQVKRISPDTPHLYSLLASSCRNLGEPDNALQFAREELKRNPNDIPSLEVCVAVLTQQQGDAQEMIRDLRRLTALEPNKVEHEITLAQVLVGQNNVTDVLPVLDRILQLSPNNAEMYALRGFSRFFADGSPAGLQRAEDDLVHALSLHPKMYLCYLYLGKIYRRREQWEKSAAFLEEAARLKPEKQDAYFDLAAVYRRMNQPGKAAAALRRFEEIAQATDRYAHLKKRADLAPGDLNLNLQAGQMALQRENLPEAHYYLQRAVQLGPNDTRVQAALRRFNSLSAMPVSSTPPVSGLPGIADSSAVSGGP